MRILLLSLVLCASCCYCGVGKSSWDWWATTAPWWATTAAPVVTAPVVSTDCGPVRGKVDTAAGGTPINTYRNIPYAVPPLRELRWKLSSLLSEGDGTCWEGEYDGAKDDIIECVQDKKKKGKTKGEEDCLVLSVRTPDVTGCRSVIVWIHGGGLTEGSGEGLEGYTADADFTETMDAVTVNINYRLGVMGFVSVEEFRDSSTGNYANWGFSDQITALRWVAANIANFGGNPNSVTIVGESSGADSVQAMLAAPGANNLFHKGIAFSGATWYNTSLVEERENPGAEANLQLFKNWMRDAGCNQESKSQRLACMQTVGIEPLINAAIPVYARPSAYFDFPMSDGWVGETSRLAVIEPTIMPKPPQDLANVDFTPNSKIKVILSNLAEEQGIMGMQGKNTFPNTHSGWRKLDKTLVERMRNIPEYTLKESGEEILDKMWAQGIYPHQSSGDWTPQKAWDTIATDLRGTCSYNALAKEMEKSENHDIYRLYITHHIPGAPSFHVWDALALFGLKNFEYDPSLSPADLRHCKKFQAAIQGLVRDFVHDVDDGSWETYPRNVKVLTNSAPWSEVVDDVQSEQCTFWKDNKMDKWWWQD